MLIEEEEEPSNKPILETYIHRINNISTKPNSILKIFSHKDIIIISRSDGSIEILQQQKQQTLFPLYIIPGISSIPINNIVCCIHKNNKKKYRFFCSSEKNNNFFSIDNNNKLTYNHITNSNGGCILCMMEYYNNNDCLLACGCEDGFIRI